MGVQGLWDLLAPVGRRVSVETLAGKRLAIDASIWMIQFMKAMRDERGEMVRNAHLLGFFRRICKLLFLRTKPVFVFDGGTPVLKRRTVIARRRQRDNAQAKVRKTAEKLLLNQLKKMRLKELEKELEQQRIKNHGKGKNVALSEEIPEDRNYTRAGCITQEEIDGMLAVSLAAEERDAHNNGASTSSSAFGQDGGLSTSSFMDDVEEEEDEDDEEMILPITDGKIDPTVLAALPPSMQLDLLVQMRERLMAENRQKYQKVKKAPQEFSELQIETYLKTVAFRREIDEVQKAASGKGVGGLQTARIASEANKEFIFSSSFTGDKQHLAIMRNSVLASAGLKKTAEKQDGEELVPSLTQPTTLLASAVTSTSVSVPSGDVAPTTFGKETMRDFGSDVQTYRDERGIMRVSRARAMGIRMTRDLQRNLDLMKEMEREMISAGIPVSAGLPVNVPINPAEDVTKNKLILENFSEISIRSSTTTEKLDKNRSTIMGETSLEISFEDDAQCIPVDNDDDFFVRLVAGDPDPINSVCDTVSKDNNLESDSDCEWEEGNIGMQIENVKSEVKTSQLEGNSDDETELQWEDGFSNNPEDSSLFPAMSVKTKSRGSIEEEAALQEAIRRSLEGLKGEKDASYNLERDNKVIRQTSEAPPSQDNEIGVPKNGSSDSSVSGTGLLNDMSERKSSDIAYSPDMIQVVSADNACENKDMVVDRPSNCVPSDVGCASEFGFSVSAKNAETQSNTVVGTTDKSYVVLSDVPCETSCSTLHPHVIDPALADPLHLTCEKTSQTGGAVAPIQQSNEAPAIAINLEKSEKPGSDAGISRRLSEEEPIHGVYERDHNFVTIDNEYNNIQGAGAHLDDEFQMLDEEYAYLEDERRKLERNADSLNAEMIVECQELLHMFGLPYVIAPMEAEAQCAYMELVGLVDGVVTDDSDVFLFGARSVYKNIFDDRKYVETYLMKDMENELGLSREKLVKMALLLGSDYTEGVRGIGIVNAIEVVNAFPEEDGLSKFREWVESPDPTILGLSGMTSSKKNGSKSSDTSMNVPKDDMDVTSSDCDDHGKTKDNHELENVPKINQIFMEKHRKVSKNWHIPSSFPSQAVISAYASPQVDKSTDPCSWGKPDLSALRRLCWEKLGWAGQKADDLLLPVLKEYNKNETQLRLEAFYTFNERFAKIRSKRINKAVKGITGNQSLKSSNDSNVGVKRNRRKNPVKDNTVCGEVSLANLPKKPRKSKTQRENFPSEKKTSESILEKDIGSCADAGTTTRGKQKTQAVGRRKRGGICDIKFSDADSNINDEELQFQKLEASGRVRRSTRSKKAAKYAESDDEIDLTAEPMSDPTEEEKHRDRDFDNDDSVCNSEMEQCTPVVSVPDDGLCGDDHLLNGCGFCADEDEPVNETDTLQGDSAPVEVDRHYLQMGGGFCFDDPDADDDSQNRTSEETKGTPRKSENNAGQMGLSELPRQGLNSVANIHCSNPSGLQQTSDAVNGSLSQPRKAMLEAQDDTNSPLKALSAMPNLRRKRKKSS